MLKHVLQKLFHNWAINNNDPEEFFATTLGTRYGPQQNPIKVKHHIAILDYGSHKKNV